MKNTHKIICIPLLVGCGINLQSLQAQVSQPNIIFIMADDLGWNDLGMNGSDYYETPHIDRLASEGIFFNNAYAAAANSAPSRACFMTGLYTPRHGVYTVSPSDRGDKTKRKLIPIKNKEDVASDFVTLAEALKQEGYICGHIGKWHLGSDQDGTNTGPLSQGFDYNIAGERAGTPYSYFYPYCNKAGKCHIGLEEGEKGEYLTDRLTDEAVRFIKEQKESPFFLYLAHHAVHTPIQAPDRLVEKYKNKEKGKYHTNPVYAAMIEALDQSVGRVCHAVDSLGIAGNTLIVFFSDNGGLLPVTNNYQIRGGKGMPYEGGSRVPLIMRQPGIIPEGIVDSTPVTGVDFYPTFVSLAGGIPADYLDGENIFELAEKKQDRAIYWHFPAYLQGSQGLNMDFRATPYSTIRSGNWKLIYYYEDRRMELFNLQNDPMEESDLAPYCAGKRDELYYQLHQWIEKTSAPTPSLLNPAYIVEDENL